MKYLVSEKISPHRSIDNSGYLVCTDAILSRTGVQDYAEAEIFADSSDYEKKIHVNRTEDEVFSEQALASFENKPVTIEHPDEDVNPENYHDYTVGFVRDIHRGKTEDGQDVMMGTLVITDQDAIDQIQNGEYKYLSCGYDCDFVGDDNEMQQRNIRGNHVALCKTPRAGITRIQDSIKSTPFSAKLKFKDSAVALSAKAYADRFLIPASVTDSNLIVYSKSEKKLDNIKSIIHSKFDCEDVVNVETKDSNYGKPIERNTVTIRRGYHNLSDAADKFAEVYQLSMKETSDINKRLLLNTLESIYIDAYNDSKQVYQKDLADAAVERYIKAIQLANDFKIKRKSQLTADEAKRIDDYYQSIESLCNEIEKNSIPSTFKKDILEMLDRYNENAEGDEQSIEFEKDEVVKNKEGEPVEEKEEIENVEKIDDEPIKTSEDEEEPSKKETHDSIAANYTVIADSPEEATRLVKMVREYEKRK